MSKEETKKKEVVKKTLLKVATKEAVKEFYDCLMLEEKAKEEEKEKLALEKERLSLEKERAHFLSNLKNESNRVELFIEFLDEKELPYSQWDLPEMLGKDVYDKLLQISRKVKDDLEDIFMIPKN